MTARLAAWHFEPKLDTPAETLWQVWTPPAAGADARPCAGAAPCVPVAR